MELELGFDFSSPLAICLTVASVILFISVAIAECRIFQKAGEKPWKALIPFYGLFVSHHIIGMSHIWFIIDMILWFIELVTELVELPWYIDDFFLLVASVFTIISEIIHINKLCNCFGKKLPFKIGMFLLPQVFPLIIAFGKAEYHKPEPKRTRESKSKT